MLPGYVGDPRTRPGGQVDAYPFDPLAECRQREPGVLAAIKNTDRIDRRILRPCRFDDFMEDLCAQVSRCTGGASQCHRYTELNCRRQRCAGICEAVNDDRAPDHCILTVGEKAPLKRRAGHKGPARVFHCRLQNLQT